MTNASGSSTASRPSSPRLRVDFYESGIGDTIIITFPSGGIGIVDAHPSTTASRPEIDTLVAGKKIHFVCLTHPHADHGLDLVPVLEKNAVDSFWHTTTDIRTFLDRVSTAPNYRSELREWATKHNEDWRDFAVDVFGAVIDLNIPRRVLHADLAEQEIDGVSLHILSPEEEIQNEFVDALLKRIDDPARDTPDPNLLSAIIALQFGKTVVLLGADALQKNWASAYQRWHRRALPKAKILKVPHHGAKNSLDLGQKRPHTYLDMCEFTPRAAAVLFAGDKKHPEMNVYRKLVARTEVHCLSNGTKTPATNPLRLQWPAAKSVTLSVVCQPVISFEVDSTGVVTTLGGHTCNACPL